MSADDEVLAAPASTPISGLVDAQPIDEDATRTQYPFATVAIGASAGGVQALSQLFKAMPIDTGCAFVVVLHLSPDHESMLAPLLGRSTEMKVVQAVDGTTLEPDHVYVNAPGQYIEIHAGKLRLRPIGVRPPKSMTVDRFMISLAVDQREQAIGIVLTGSDSDGSLGVKAIKSEGGLTIAQAPASAAYAGMPEHAIATGLIDQQLSINEIPAALVAYVEDAGLRDARREPPEDDHLPFILDGIQRQVGLDFVGYKTPMLYPRVKRRMGLCRISTMSAYVDRLQSTPTEAQALADNFLISVTEFFRERDSWAMLAKDVIPTIVAGKAASEPVRVWVPACATGEEAYSLAMLFLEDATVLERRIPIQIFATDIDRRALEIARRAQYSSAIEQTIGASRLRTFFHKGPQGYQVRKALRELITFAPQNIVNDPPFSRMDLISCRNMLIYMGTDLQRRVIEMFHFALVHDGFLTLGKSETVPHPSALFRQYAVGTRVFRRVGPVRVAAAKLPLAAGLQTPRPSKPASPQQRRAEYSRVINNSLTENRATAAVVTNREGEALYFHGALRGFIEQPDGPPSTDVFSMVNPALRPQVRAAIHKALSERRRVELVAVLSSPGETRQAVRIEAFPVANEEMDDRVVVSFEALEPDEASPPQLSVSESTALQALELELRSTKRELRSVIEELESTNEELETSKEELQSVNEELTTVNTELLSKVEELEVVNDDLSNLLASTNIPTIFLDRALTIKRFTPAATKIFTLIASDLNRPITDIACHSDLPAIVEDARRVIETLTPIERETATANGDQYLRRTLPYPTEEDRIDGVVVTFINLTVERDMREADRHKNEFLAMLGHELRNPLVPIRNAAEVLKRIAGNDEQLHWVQGILVRQVGHMTRLVDDLLDVSTIARGSLQLRMEPVELGHVLAQVAESVESAMKCKNHELIVDVPSDAVWVEGDSIRLAQIFENLLTNACKYTNDGGKISIALTVDDKCAVVNVRDNGIGISPGMMARIFELFVQDERGIGQSQGGLGIGLALVQHLVKMHRGTVAATSAGVGLGSEFVVRLRRLAKAVTPTSESPHPDAALPGSRVLIVDDDPAGGESMGVLLKMLGYRVERAIDLDSALAAARTFRPEAVLMDIALPGANGYEVAQRLRALPEMTHPTVFIGVTGFGQPDDFKKSESAGFIAHMVKPINPNDLDFILKRELNPKRTGA